MGLVDSRSSKQSPVVTRPGRLALAVPETSESGAVKAPLPGSLSKADEEKARERMAWQCVASAGAGFRLPPLALASHGVQSLKTCSTWRQQSVIRSVFE